LIYTYDSAIIFAIAAAFDIFIVNPKKKKKKRLDWPFLSA